MNTETEGTREEQPKDYETYEEFLDSGYKDLNAFGRLTYLMQDYVWPAILVGSALGYLAGTYFGKFW